MHDGEVCSQHVTGGVSEGAVHEWFGNASVWSSVAAVTTLGGSMVMLLVGDTALGGERVCEKVVHDGEGRQGGGVSVQCCGAAETTLGGSLE